MLSLYMLANRRLAALIVLLGLALAVAMLTIKITSVISFAGVLFLAVGSAACFAIASYALPRFNPAAQLAAHYQATSFDHSAEE